MEQHEEIGEWKPSLNARLALSITELTIQLTKDVLQSRRNGLQARRSHQAILMAWRHSRSSSKRAVGSGPELAPRKENTKGNKKSQLTARLRSSEAMNGTSCVQGSCRFREPVKLF